MSKLKDVSPVDFVTMGMFILDQIHFKGDSSNEGPKMVDDIAGGAGTYAVVGARLFCPGSNNERGDGGAPSAKCLGWIVDAGSDFPDGLREELERWNTSLILRRDYGRKTTRGWNSYGGEGDHRAFKYLTPKLRLEPSDIISNQPLLSSRSFHVISSPARASSIVGSFLAAKADSGHLEDSPPPIFLWEPVPDLCTPEHLDGCLQTLKSVDIVSPNVGELAAFYGMKAEGYAVHRETVEELGTRWVDAGVKVGVVARAGKEGCFVVARQGDQCEKVWLPAYYSGESLVPEDKGVVDPTGGGNAFMGGLAIGYLRTGSLVTAACYGNVAASFAIEQIGMPRVEYADNGELWNGVDVRQRLDRYLKSIGRI